MKLEIKNVKKFIIVISYALLLYWALFNFSTVLNIISIVLNILYPFIFGMCCAFILNVLLRIVENTWNNIFENRNYNFLNYIRRPICLIITFSIVLGFIFILLFLVIPEIGKSTMLLADMLPKYMTDFKNWWESISKEFPLSENIINYFNIDWNSLITKVTSFLAEGGKYFLDTTINLTTSIFTWIVNFILGIVFSIYILLQKETLDRQLRKLMYAYLPKEKVQSIISVFILSNRIFSKFITGQVIEAFIIGFLCFVGMTIFSLPYAFTISVLVGFTALIPVFGAFFGTAIGAFMILIVSPMKAIWFILFIILLQQFEGNVIYPKVVGKSVGLPGIWVLAAVTIGGSTLGILGMLISVPICSVIYCILREDMNKRIEKIEI